MLLKIAGLKSRRDSKSPSTNVSIYSDSIVSTSNKHNIEPQILSILCWNVQVYEASKAESNPIVNSVIRDVLAEIGVDVCFLLETREHPDVNMNSIESKEETEDLDYLQIGSDLTGSLRCPPERLYLWGGGASTSDVNYTEDKKKSWRLLKRLSMDSVEQEKKEEEDEDGPADWRQLYTAELFRYYDLYRVKPAESEDADWKDIEKIGNRYCLLDQDRNVIFTKQKKIDSKTYLVWCKDIPAKTKPRSDERTRYNALSRGKVKLEDLRSECTLEILKPPGLERIAHDELDEFTPGSCGFALLDGSGLKEYGDIQEMMIIFAYKEGEDGKSDFGKLLEKSEGRWFKPSWKDDYREDWSSKFDIYAAAKAAFDPKKRKEWQWISVAPPSKNDEGEIVFRLRRCGKCEEFLGNPYKDCEDCVDFRRGTPRENLRQALQSYVGAAGWSGLESYSVLIRCNSSTKAGSVIPLEGKKAAVLRSASRLLDVGVDSKYLGYVEPGCSFYGRCPFLLPVQLHPPAAKAVLDVPVIAFHAPYGKATKEGIKARADAMEEIFKASVDPFANDCKSLDEHANAIVIGDFNLDRGENNTAESCYQSYDTRGFKPTILKTKTTLQKLDRRSWKKLKEKKPETGQYLHSAYDNVFVKGNDLCDAIDATGVVDVIDYIRENLEKYCELVDNYFVAHPKSGKKADWEAFQKDKELADHTAAYIYGTFISDHLPVLINLKAAEGKLADKDDKEEKEEKEEEEKKEEKEGEEDKEEEDKEEEEKEATPALVETIGEMLLDLGFEEKDLKERIQKFEERIGVPVEGRVNWMTYWRLLYCNNQDEYEKRKTTTLTPSKKSRRLTMIPSSFYKSSALKAFLREIGEDENLTK